MKNLLPNLLPRPLTVFRSLSQLAPQKGILNIAEFIIDRDPEKMLSKKDFRGTLVDFASHDVYSATLPGKKEKYVAKDMTQARVGFGRDEKTVTFPPHEAKQQSVLEVLATKIGGALCPGQFVEGEVAANENGNYFVVTKFIPNTVSVRNLREDHDINYEDRDESIFYLEKSDDVALRTKVTIPQDVFVERLKLSPDMENKLSRDGYTVANSLVSGRIGLNMAKWVVGENDETHNRDGNTLLALKSFRVDEKTKTINSEIMPIAIDCGLCWRRLKPEHDVVNMAFKLAIRETDSSKMGLELHGLPPTNLKKVKDKFLTESAMPAYESGEIDKHIAWATPHLDGDALDAVKDMKTRLQVCYLAGKCVEAGLDKPEKEQQARLFMREVLAKENQKDGRSY